MDTHILFITGGAGYVGAMLAHQFSVRDDVAEIICLDKEVRPDLLNGLDKVTFIQANTASDEWQNIVAEKKPDIVIHTAWQIREMYGKKDVQSKWNIEGSDAVFDFVFSHDFVKNFVHFSTVSLYGAEANNKLDYRFVESDPAREDEYLYGVEKKIVEEHLRQTYADYKKTRNNMPEVSVVRPAAITGPRGRFMRVRFGLQSALSGQLKDSKSLSHRIVSALVSIVPITKGWCRQFIHEDDVTDIVATLAFHEPKQTFEVFNICPPGPVVTGKEMAEAVHKKYITVPPWFIRFVYFLAWHISRGTIPTSRGGWKFYSYPVAVDGSKISKMYGYSYKANSHDAFTRKEGRYADFIKKP